MNIVCVFVGMAFLLMDLNSGQTSSTNGALTKAHKGEKKTIGGISPRLQQLADLVSQALGLTLLQTYQIYGYGCWCGIGGMGRTVDKFDFCCKAHDFCELNLVKPDKCGGNFHNIDQRFEYDAATDTCTPASEYNSNDPEVGKCGYAACLCDSELLRCFRRFRNVLDLDTYAGWRTRNPRDCPIPSGGLCKTKADVIVLIQDSRSISEGIRSSVQCIVRTLLTSLNSDDTDYKFVMGRYGSKTKMNSWGSAASAIYYVNYEYLKGGLGPYNRLIRVLKNQVPKKFAERSAHRKGKDPAKIVVLFTDGNTESGDGELLDTFKLQNTERVIRADNISLVGAIIPNVNGTQRIDQLKSIVSDPRDGIEMELTEANLNEIADDLAFRIRRLLFCRVSYTVKVFTPQTNIITSEFRLFTLLVGSGGKMTEDLLLHAPRTTPGVSLEYEVSGIDVGDITEVRIRSARRIQGQAGWELRKVEVTQGDQTVTAVFNENIAAFDGNWKSATPSEPEESVDV